MEVLPTRPPGPARWEPFPLAAVMYQIYDPYMMRLSASKARQEFADTLNRVLYRGERIVLRRRGKDLAALIPMEDLELLRQLEDRLDLEAARRVLREKGVVSWKKLKADLGL